MHIRLINKPLSNKIKYNLLSIFFIFIVGLSWFTNIGWIRLIFMIPMIIHAIIFYFSNRAFHKNSDYPISKSMKLVNYFVYGTYLFCNILLPDGGDTDDSIRVFFGLSHNDVFLEVASAVSQLLFLANIGLIIVQSIYIRKVRRRLKTY